jgi:hypothetical protein
MKAIIYSVRLAFQLLWRAAASIDSLRQLKPKHGTCSIIWVAHNKRITHLKLIVSNSRCKRRALPASTPSQAPPTAPRRTSGASPLPIGGASPPSPPAVVAAPPPPVAAAPSPLLVICEWIWSIGHGGAPFSADSGTTSARLPCQSRLRHLSSPATASMRTPSWSGGRAIRPAQMAPTAAAATRAHGQCGRACSS